jgi:hypothetical protein
MGTDLPKWATEKTLKEIQTILQGSGDGLKSLGNANDVIGKKFKSGTFIGGLYQAQLESEKLASKTSVVSSVLGEIAQIGGVAVKSLFKSSGKFTDLNPVIDATTGAAANLAMAFGPLGVAVGVAVKAFGDFRQAQNEILDNQVQGFMQLSKSGLNLTTDIQDLNVAALRARLNLDVLADVVTANAAGITALGGEFTRGVSRFLQLQTDISERENNMLERMGINIEEQAMFIGEFIENNQRNAVLANMSQGQLADTVFGLAKNMRILTELTGEDINTQRQAQMQVAGDMAFQARIRELTLAGQQDEAAALNQLVATLETVNPDLARLVKQSVSTVGMGFDAQTAVLAQVLGGQESINKILGGVEDIEDVPKVVADLLELSNQAANSTNNLQMAQLSLGGITNEYFTALQDVIEAGGRFDNIIKAAEEDGLSVAQYLEQMFADTTDGADTIATSSMLLMDAAIELDKAAKTFNAAVLANFDDLFDKQIQSNTRLTEDLKILTSENANVFQKGLAGFETILETSGAATIDRYIGDFVDALTGDFFNYSEQGFFGSLKNLIPGATPNLEQNYTGGLGFPGQLSMVGEGGAELVRFGQLGEVINNSTTTDIMGAAAGIVDALKSPTNTQQTNTTQTTDTTTQLQNTVRNMSDDILKQIAETLNQSNMIQSSMLKETKRVKRFDY